MKRVKYALNLIFQYPLIFIFFLIDMLNITAFSFGTDEIESCKDAGDDGFTFIVDGKEYNCPIKGAEILSPTVYKLRKNDQNLCSYALNVHDKRKQFGILLSLIKGNQIILSKANSQIFLKFAEELGNEKLYESAHIASLEDVDPETFINYVIGHKEQGVSIVYDLQRIAENFEFFYAAKNFDKLTLDDLKTLSKMNGLSAISKRILQDKINKITKKPRNIEDYFHQKAQKPKVIVAHRKGNDNLNGLLRALSKQIQGNPILTQHVVVESKNNPKNAEIIIDPKNNQFCTFQKFIQFDFKERRIKLSGYSIRVGNKTEMGEVPAKFVLLGSNNLYEWNAIDEKVSYSQNFMHPYGEYVSNAKSEEHYRFINLILLENFSSNPNRKGNMQICSIEFFGELKSI